MTYSSHPNLLCYIKWKSLVNLKCICWAKSKYLYTSGIKKHTGAALPCSSRLMVISSSLGKVERENPQLLGIPRETLAPLNSAVPSSSLGDSRRPAPTPSPHLSVSQHLFEAPTFSEMQPGPKETQKRKIHSVMKQ